MSKNETDFKIVRVNKSCRITIPRKMYSLLDPKEGENFVVSVDSQTKDSLVVRVKRLSLKDLQALV